MLKYSSARAGFLEEISRPDDEIDLAAAALCIAWEDQGTDKAMPVLSLLDDLARMIRPHLESATDLESQVAAMHKVLFDEMEWGFDGDDWGTPQLYYLDKVLMWRTGMSVVLSIIYLEAAWRLGLPVSGLLMPGHMVVQFTTPDQRIIVDPFCHGRRWTEAECHKYVIRNYPETTPEEVDRLFTPPSKRDILRRLLHNLKYSYINSEQPHLVVSSTDRLALLNDVHPLDIHNRGLAHLHLNRMHAALADFDYYLRRDPEAPDADKLLFTISTFGAWIAPKN
jgi:regulator of sirC expression with transglutaminase-like and TPR domain